MLNLLKSLGFVFVFGFFFTACSEEKRGPGEPFSFELHDLNIESSFRGISAVNDSVCWLSGTKGTVIRTTDGGDTWKEFQIPRNSKIDLRDIHAFNADTAVVMGIGSPAKIFRTEDGGESWYLTYFNDHPKIFLDGIAFLDDRVGMAFGDAIENKIVILKTYDAGKSWHVLPNHRLPDAVEKEGGFAASGSSIQAQTTSTAFIGLGYPRGRVLYSKDFGENWEFFLSGLGNGDANRGVYSLEVDKKGNGIAVGGDWEDPDNNHLVAAITSDGGRHWGIVSEQPPGGYRSAVALIPYSDFALTTGPNGTDFSTDKGKSWTPAKTGGANCISVSPSGEIGWMGGKDGRVIVFKLRH